jgi:RNA polymerase sigma factor (sigma-70 family)
MPPKYSGNRARCQAKNPRSRFCGVVEHLVGSDAEIIRRSWSEPEVFEVIFDRHYEAVHRFAAGRVGIQDAPDIAAETFARAFDRRQRFRLDRRSALPWLYGIAVNVCREGRRRNSRGQHATTRIATRDEMSTEAFENDLTERVDAQRLRPDLLAALRGLTDDEYALLMLAGESDMSYQQMADALGIPIGTVRSRLARARRRVRHAIGVPAIAHWSSHVDGD